jgi:integrase
LFRLVRRVSPGGPPWRSDGGLGVVLPWVVTEPDGSVIHPDTLLGRWRRLVAAAGVPAIPLHDARHSYAMLALGAGARLDMVSRQLGHASAAFPADIYTHDSDEVAQTAAALVGGVLGE